MWRGPRISSQRRTTLNAPTAKGRPAIEAFHKAFGQQWMMHGMTITSGGLKISGDVAHDVGTY